MIMGDTWMRSYQTAYKYGKGKNREVGILTHPNAIEGTIPEATAQQQTAEVEQKLHANLNFKRSI